MKRRRMHDRFNTVLAILILGFVIIASAPAGADTSSPLVVAGRFLQDANGANIMMRGVDVPVYGSGWADDLDAVAAAVAATKVNVVRLEWWANPLAIGGPPEYTVANLDLAIQKYVDLGILPIVTLFDLTWGRAFSNDQTLFANTITAFWTRDDVLPVLIKHQNHLVINVANEWGSTIDSNGNPIAANVTNFIDNYTAAITAMRNAGITSPLLVDAPQGFEYQFILDNGQAILNADPQHNVMLSVHAYWADDYYNDAAVNLILNNIKKSSLPIILGEASSDAWTTTPCDPIDYANLLGTANTNSIGYLIWAWYQDGQCGLNMNITVNADGITVPTDANPGFGYDVLFSPAYGINTALPATTKIIFNSSSCSQTLSSSSSNPISPSGGTGSVSVTASASSCTWTATSNASWINITSGSSGTGSGTVGYTVAGNTSSSSRIGTITIAGQTFTVTQSGVQQYNLTITNSGTGSGTVTADSGTISWNGSTGTASYSSGASVTLTATPASGSTFTGWAGCDSTNGNTCTVSMTFGRSLIATFTAAACTYSISPTSQSVSYSGTTGSVTVTSSSDACTWTATSNVSWITIRSGSGTVGYTVAGNTSSSSRIGTITIAGQTFAVTQAGLTSGSTIQVGGAGAYSTIESGYNAAVTGDTIQIQVGVYAETLSFNNNMSVVLIGGYDSSFSTVSSNTVINGTLTIRNGTVTVGNIIIQ